MIPNTENGSKLADDELPAKVRGRDRITGNRSVRSRPLAPPQPPPRIAIAGDVPRGAASRRLSVPLVGQPCQPTDRSFLRFVRTIPDPQRPASDWRKSGIPSPAFATVLLGLK